MTTMLEMLTTESKMEWGTGVNSKFAGQTITWPARPPHHQLRYFTQIFYTEVSIQHPDFKLRLAEDGINGQRIA